MDDQSSPLQIGVPLDQSSLLFFGCLIGAIGLVYLSCRKKFSERSVTGNDDYIYQFLPRQLATREEYSKGFLTYFGTMALTVLLLSLIGPKNLAALGIPLPKEVSYVVVPLAIAFVLVTVLPNVPGLLLIEQYLRQYALERAYIPAAARATAERLAAADFDFSGYQTALQAPEMRGVEASDFTQPRRSLEHDWARLSSLVYELKSRRESGITGPLDAGLLRDYETDLERIEDKRRNMAAEIEAYRRERAGNPGYTNDVLRRTIRDSLYRLYVLIGCAVRLNKQPHDDIELALRPFGFELRRSDAAPPSDDLKVVGLSMVVGCVLLLLFAAVWVGHFKFWQVTPAFPSSFMQPFIDTVTTVIPFVSAILFADLARRHAIGKGTWFGPADRRKAARAKYIKVALICGIFGFVALSLWGFVLKTPTIAGLKIEFPYALLAMLTGGFYVYHLDNVELDTRPPRFWEVAPQAVLTGICGFAAACASWETLLPRPGFEMNGMPLVDAYAVMDQIALTAVTSAIVGLLLAWYVPQAAAAAKYDPLAEAKEERVATLEAAAVKHFGNIAAARDWLDRQHPVLDGKSPRSAADDLEGFEHASSLLQRPQALAA
jgi:hypothetical protein